MAVVNSACGMSGRAGCRVVARRLWPLRWVALGWVALGWVALGWVALGCAAGAAAATPSGVSAPPLTLSEVIAASKRDDWRLPDLENTLYLDLASPGGSEPSGRGPFGARRVVMELAPAFAPRHVANLRALVRENYFDGLSIVRVQENYVVQWADPDATRAIRTAQRTLPAEFERSARGVPFTPLPDPDTYAPEVGFADGFPVARDAASGVAWLVHCYGMLGAGRDNGADSGGGAELYVVTGHAPRQLDRNVTLLGRVLSGMELLTTLPRGTGALGFYEKPEQRVPIERMRLAVDVPAEERTELELLRTDTLTFAALVESRRNRHEEWFKRAAGHIDVCNVPLVVRPLARPGSG